MLTTAFCKWFWSGLNRYLNTEPHRVFGALRFGNTKNLDPSKLAILRSNPFIGGSNS